ncbi:hypothetical protein [Streptomyces sp. NPDC047028]|uniref:SCO2400 family protein n=1 Tax=Streptomyces sp. NPDC047028 TaxID=3155793 RepID=UPI0033C59BB7
MDYCSSCRRHLNGALVCPGCGAYAPDIAPSTTPAAASGFAPAAPYDSYGSYGSYGSHDFVPGPAAFPLTEMTAPAERPAPVAPDTWDADGNDHGDGDVDLEAVPVAPRGRAARRRQRARWKKTQRRAVVATAVALVGGGLTLASMDRQSGDRAQAAAGPKDPGAGQSAQDDVLPTSPRPDTQRSVPTTHTLSPASGHTTAHYATASVRTAPGGRPGTGNGTQVHTAALSAPQSYTAASSSDGTASGHTGTAHTTSTGTTNTAGTTSSTGTTAVTTPVQSPAPAPAPTSGTDSGTSPTTTTSSTSTTSDQATQPQHQHQQLCLLVLCVG